MAFLLKFLESLDECQCVLNNYWKENVVAEQGRFGLEAHNEFNKK